MTTWASDAYVASVMLCIVSFTVRLRRLRVCRLLYAELRFHWSVLRCRALFAPPVHVMLSFALSPAWCDRCMCCAAGDCTIIYISELPWKERCAPHRCSVFCGDVTPSSKFAELTPFPSPHLAGEHAPRPSQLIALHSLHRPLFPMFMMPVTVTDQVSTVIPP